MILLACLEGLYLIEQPANSVMLLHPRLYWAFRILRKMAGIRVSRLFVNLFLLKKGPTLYETGNGIFASVLSL